MAPNKNYHDQHSGDTAGEPGKIEGIRSKAKSDPQGDPKFVAAPDNVKKDGMGFGNDAKGGGKGSASHD